MRRPFLLSPTRPGRVVIALPVAVGCLIGCGPSDNGALDVERSKAIAAEKKIGPGAKSVPVKTVKTRGRGRRSRPVQTGPAAPPPR